MSEGRVRCLGYSPKTLAFLLHAHWGCWRRIVECTMFSWLDRAIDAVRAGAEARVRYAVFRLAVVRGETAQRLAFAARQREAVRRGHFRAMAAWLSEVRKENYEAR